MDINNNYQQYRHKHKKVLKFAGIISDVKNLSSNIEQLHCKVRKLSDEFDQLDCTVTRNEVEILLLRKKLQETVKKQKTNQKQDKEIGNQDDHLSKLHTAESRPKLWYSRRRKEFNNKKKIASRHVRISVDEGVQTDNAASNLRVPSAVDSVTQMLNRCKTKTPRPLVFDEETFNETGHLVTKSRDHKGPYLSDWAYAMVFVHFHVTFFMSFFLE